MSNYWMYPKGTDLAKAIRWLSDQHRHDLKAVEQAAFQFDLSPLDEEFLIEHFCIQKPLPQK